MSIFDAIFPTPYSLLPAPFAIDKLDRQNNARKGQQTLVLANTC
ncbi:MULTISPECIES: hypothetical protein [Moorena]|nr:MULTISPECIES: hypothetical protein [Moorena]